MPRFKENSITRFNVNTHLTESMKFMRLRKALGFDEARTYATLIRFWNFVAQNRAVIGNIENIEAWIIADFCWWDSKNDGDPEILIQSLKKTGFIDEDGKVHDWFHHQPLAVDAYRKRTKLGQSSDKARTKLGQSSDKSSLTEQNRTEGNRTKEQQQFDENVDNLYKNVGRRESLEKTGNTNASPIDINLLEAADILNLSNSDRGTLRYWFGKLAVKTGNSSVGSRLVGEVKESMESKKPPYNPMGVLIYKIQVALGIKKPKEGEDHVNRI